MIENPNPTPALELMKKVIDHLVQDLHWPLNQIHLFGFAQGGSVAAEYALLRWREQLRGQEAGASPPATSFGSLVTVSGSLISYPTIANLSPTPTLVVYRSAPAEDALQPTAVRAFKKGFQSVSEAKLGGNRSGMPASKEEWEPIMKFWSERLSRRKMDGLYEVMSGMST
jgi:pimeloyl-ACP methyl ester carboxylesterase